MTTLIEAMKAPTLSMTHPLDPEMFDAHLSMPTLDEIRAAEKRLAPCIIRTPLLRFDLHDQSNAVYLKLENLQVTGAFKSRPMGNALLSADRDALQNGVYTASSGNAGVGLAWMARQLGVDARVYVPGTGTTAKIDAIRKFGASVCPVTAGQWWQIVEDNGHPAESGYFVDAVRNPAALAGNGTIGLEIVEQLPEVDSIVVPFGGGGAVCGIAAAVKALKPEVRIVAAETEAAAPATAAFREGRPVRIPMAQSFISGAGAPTVLEEMWPLVERAVDQTVVVPVTQVAEAIRLLFEHNHVVAEGAGAISLAGALGGNVAGRATVCVITGGNIDRDMFCRILDRQL